MDRLMGRLFFENWQQKLLALMGAIVVWFFVNHSIIETKTIPNIPIRIANIPQKQTIRGLQPNGILDRRMTLTLSGTKNIIEELEPGDLEVLLDASTAESDEWIVHVTKKNLVSLNPSIDLSHHITQVDHSEFLLKLSELVTEKVPINVSLNHTKSPQGFEFLDIWPTQLTQTISGPREDVERLKQAGLELPLDLTQISREDLESHIQDGEDELTFFVPNKWKTLYIPFLGYDEEPVNDPLAAGLRIDFLNRSLHPVDAPIPIRVYYPVQTIDTINPQTVSLSSEGVIKDEKGIFILDEPIFARNVGRLFLEVIKNNLEIVILASPKEEREFLHWNVEVHDPSELEDTYVAYLINNDDSEEEQQGREQLLRNRFRQYAQNMRFFTQNDQKLRLRPVIDGSQIRISTNTRG